MLRLVKENLDYEKIRSQQITLNKLDVPLIEVFEIVKEHLQQQAEEKTKQADDPSRGSRHRTCRL